MTRFLSKPLPNFLTFNIWKIIEFSRFKPVESQTSQPVAIIQKTWRMFDVLEVRSVFLELSKAFDKVKHERLILKLEQNRISGDLLNILADFLNNRKYRNVLKECCSVGKYMIQHNLYFSIIRLHLRVILIKTLVPS